MAKTAVRTRRGNRLVERIREYIKETRAEIGRVTWPTREQALRLTGIVLAVTTAMAAFLALVDYVFAWYVARVLALDLIAIGVSLLLVVAAGPWWFAVGRRR